MRPRTAMHAAIVGAAMAAVPAWAQTVPSQQSAPTAATPAARDVREIYRQAVLDYQAGKYQQAYDAFKEVWSTEKKPKVAGNLGRAAFKLRKHCEAAEYLSIYKEQEKGLSPAEILDVQRQIDEASVYHVKLTVNAPSGSAVLVDGQSAGTAPLPGEICVDPGHHTVEARHGTATTRKEIDAASGTQQTVTLERAATPPPPLPAATPQERSMVPVAVLGAVGAAGLVAGGISLGVYVAKRDEALGMIEAKNLKGLCANNAAACDDNPDIKQVRAIAEEGDVYRTAAPILLVGGAVSAAAALAYYLWWPIPGPQNGNKGSAGGPRVSVAVTPVGGAVSISGRF